MKSSLKYLALISLVLSIQGFSGSSNSKCPAPEPDSFGEFVKLSAISKYFYFESRVENPFSYTYEEADHMCRKYDLELAEFTSLTDWNSVGRFISEMRDHYWIGINDIRNEGNFVESDGVTKIRFQAFTGSNPDNGDVQGDEDCVQIIHDGGLTKMDDKPCEATAGVLCQFPRGSYCSINSFQQNAGMVHDLVPLGSSTHFYVSQVQKTRAEANGACLMAGKYLLAFNSKEMNQELMEEMKFYRTTSDLGPEATFWTSGTVTKGDMGDYSGTIFWDILDSEYSYMQNPINLQFEWGYGEPRNDYGGEKDCLDVSYENLYMMSGPPVPIWRASNCLLPKFFICMDLNMTVPIDEMRKKFERGQMNKEMDEDKDPDCDSLISNIEPFKLGLEKPLSVDQTMNLMLFSLKNDLSSGKTKVTLRDGISWKRDIIELMFNIFKKSVGSEYVDYGFLNSALELNLIYQNSVSGDDESADSEQWNIAVIPVLKKCLNRLEELTFETMGLKIMFYNSSSNPENMLRVPQEEADLYSNLDMTLDALWYIFSFSLGICYPKAGSGSSIWAAQYIALFSFDFIEKLEDKWVMKDDAGILKQSLIFGNVDVFTAMDNLRAATTAAYLRNDILDRQVVRPLTIEKLEGKKMLVDYQTVNFKTGAIFK